MYFFCLLICIFELILGKFYGINVGGMWFFQMVWSTVPKQSKDVVINDLSVQLKKSQRRNVNEMAVNVA